jgi:hypothetical protein
MPLKCEYLRRLTRLRMRSCVKLNCGANLAYETCAILSSRVKNSSNSSEKIQLNPRFPIKKLDLSKSGPLVWLPSWKAFRTGGGMIRESCPNMWLAELRHNHHPHMNKQPLFHQDRKTRRQVKVHDLAVKKDQRAGSSDKTDGSENANSAIPTSLQEFLQRDSLPINAN